LPLLQIDGFSIADVAERIQDAIGRSVVTDGPDGTVPEDKIANAGMPTSEAKPCFPAGASRRLEMFVMLFGASQGKEGVSWDYRERGKKRMPESITVCKKMSGASFPRGFFSVIEKKEK